MPELAEVEFFRKQWDRGIGERILRVHLNDGKRVFRGTSVDLLRALEGEALVESAAAGKQMLFRFSGDLWVGIHLGMSGTLENAGAGHQPRSHDHLVLFPKGQALIYNDPRQFGRVQAHAGPCAPHWWTTLSPSVISPLFTPGLVDRFLQRHPRLPMKAALLAQEAFPGIGNWMADEILWRAGIAPGRLCGSLSASERRAIWREVRYVARHALRTIGQNYGDAPGGWLFHERWSSGGVCPVHREKLRRETIGGRTSAWCARCQK